MIMMFQVGISRRISAVEYLTALITGSLKFLSPQTQGAAAPAQPCLLYSVPPSDNINFFLARPITEYVPNKARPH